MGQPSVFIKFHDLGIVERIRYSRSGMPVSAMRADLIAVLRMLEWPRLGAQRELGKRLGMSEQWVHYLVTGKLQRVRLATALRIAELARGTRSSLPEPLILKNRKNQRALRARKAVL